MQLRSLPMHHYLFAIAALVVANVFVYHSVFAGAAPRVETLTAGENTVTLVRERGMALLIDTGADASILRTLGQALPPWERSLDAVILTSDQAAQAGGLTSVESRYHVSTVLRAGTADFPYGTTISFGGVPITITKPGNKKTSPTH